MSYFKNFPIIENYQIQETNLYISDITIRNVIRNIRDDENLYIWHRVVNGESPIVLADRMYDDSDLFWVIMLVNDIHDIEQDWPLTQLELERYVDRVYQDRNAIHHYESILDGNVVDANYPDYNRVSITNIEHCFRENEKKRNIILPIPSVAIEIQSEHKRLIRR